MGAAIHHRIAKWASFLMLAALALFIILEILAYKKVITITESENNPYDGKNLAFLVITLLSISLLGQSGAQVCLFQILNYT